MSGAPRSHGREERADNKQRALTGGTFRMKRRDFLPLLAAPLLPRGAFASAGSSLEWPQWRGPDRTGVSSETGLAKSWPAGGPPQGGSRSRRGRGYGSLGIFRARIHV